VAGGIAMAGLCWRRCSGEDFARALPPTASDGSPSRKEAFLALLLKPPRASCGPHTAHLLTEGSKDSEPILTQ
jgi:hypothetical protein